MSKPRTENHERMFPDGRIFKNEDEFKLVLNERQRVAKGRGR